MQRLDLQRIACLISARQTRRTMVRPNEEIMKFGKKWRPPNINSLASTLSNLSLCMHLLLSNILKELMVLILIESL